jgi:16S rRNA processing protein RimM
MSSKPNSNINTGSHNSDEPVFVIIGKFRKPHGIQGEIRMTVITDVPELIQPGTKIFVGEKHHPYTIKGIRWHGGDMLVALEELPDRSAVEIFRNVMVYIKGVDFPEPKEGEYYLHQLVGLAVITDQNQVLGKVKEVLITGANDVLLVEPESGRDILLPVIDQVVLEINRDAGHIIVHIIPGLLD